MPKPLDQDLETWFEELYKKEYKSLKHRAASCLARVGENAGSYAEDVVQRTYLKAWQIKEEFAAMEKPEGWLCTAIAYTTWEVHRENDKWRHKLILISDRVITRTGIEYQLKLELEGLMSDKDYDLLKRLYIDGETYKKLSRKLGIKQSTLAMRVKRLKEQVAEEYKKYS